MGYIRHDAVIAVGYIYDSGDAAELNRAVDALRAEMGNESRLLVGPIAAATNRYTIYAYLPDGSKAGWDTDERHNEWRERFVVLVNAAKRFDVLTAEFGGDEPDLLFADVYTDGDHEAHGNSARRTTANPPEKETAR